MNRYKPYFNEDITIDFIPILNKVVKSYISKNRDNNFFTGDCANFAEALFKFIQYNEIIHNLKEDKDYYIVTMSDNSVSHTVLFIKGKYIDASGINTKNQIKDKFATGDGKVVWEKDEGIYNNSGVSSTKILNGLENEFEKFYPDLSSKLSEDITIPLSKGDTFFYGKFKNKQAIYASDYVNEKGDPIIVTDTGHEIPMAKIRLLTEKAIKVDVSWVKPILLKIKNKLIGRNFGNLEVEEILNRAFANHLVKFESGFDSQPSSDFYSQVNIIRGGIYENGLVEINYYSNFYEVFDDDYLYNDFIKVVTSIIYHERIHNYQIASSRNKTKFPDMSSNTSYLSNKNEIMSHAQQAVFDLINSGYTIAEIKNKLKTKNTMNYLIDVDSFWKYYDYFGRDYDAKIKDKYSYVWPLYLKYFYSALHLKENIKKKIFSENLRFSDLMKKASISPFTMDYSKETNRLMGAPTTHTKLKGIRVNKKKDYVIFIWKTKRTPKYDNKKQPMKAVDPKDEFKMKNANFYTIEIKVLDFFKLLKTKPDNNFTNKDIEEVFAVADIQVWSSVPAYQYQGMNYNMSLFDASIYPELRAPKIWNDIVSQYGKTHNEYQFLDKHTAGVINSIKFFFPIMRQMIKRYLDK